MKTRNQREQVDQDAKHDPVIEILDNPKEAELISKLVSYCDVIREDDTPEEAATRLAAMALTLSNIAAAHLVVEVQGEEADLGVGFAIEGGYLATDIEELVIAPAYRYQDRWERNLLHNVDPVETRKARMHYKAGEMTSAFCDSLLLPSEYARLAFLRMQKQQLEKKLKQAESKQAEGAEQPPPKMVLPTLEEYMAPLLAVDGLILFNRKETLYREVMDYRVFIAEASRSAAFEQRVMRAHMGRFLLHSRIDTCADLERIGKMLEDYTGHRSVRNGNATLTLHADPVLCVGPNVLNEAVSRGLHRKPALNRLLWLVETSVGGELPDPRKRKPLLANGFVRFHDLLDEAMRRRINFKNNEIQEMPTLNWELANWRRFLRERERHCPGITAAVRNLPFALCYGIGSMFMNSAYLCGDEVMALAKWLVMRMVNRLAVASTDGSHSCVERLALKLANKLTTYGPMTVRELMRKCTQLNATDCRQALDWLEDRELAAKRDRKWGILGNVSSVHAFAAAD